MNAQEERQIGCPYCGELIDVLIDPSVDHQTYIEDCQVCCQPINFDVTINHNGEITIRVSSDYE